MKSNATTKGAKAKHKAIRFDRLKVTDKIRLSPVDLLAFWNAVQKEPSLTPAQRELARTMRGER